MKVINGRWIQDGESVVDNTEFSDKLVRVKEFARGRELTHSKIEVLFRILDTNEQVDKVLSYVLSMDSDQLKKILS